MDASDRLVVTCKAWLKILARMDKRIDNLTKRVDELAKGQKDILRALLHSPNGHKRSGN
jgi:hypothetical protein